MKVATGGLVRTTSGLNFRAGRGTGHKLLAVLNLDALLHPLEDGTGSWLHARLYGWRHKDGADLYTDPDERAAKKARLTGGVPGVVSKDGEWNFVVLDGYVSSDYVTVVDGPK